MFDPPDDGRLNITTRRVAAEAFCEECPDREPCAEFAAEHGLTGL
ncbi:hypothetical protein [Pseudonocardia charpentierae]|uniref:4Fe-4S Wbl-type domain-containing protein n=1 Tax=Pseudonocardia charpentierae TaxID=3075545 RepID=A0ABU2NIF4_9PSEU|nr:hypothetical protein [Pseudonocardia sp. DSM 45834]MDT0353741.1 hypothetical protein [Pseudonocardia sp. DSM 45834]